MIWQTPTYDSEDKRTRKAREARWQPDLSTANPLTRYGKEALWRPSYARGRAPGPLKSREMEGRMSRAIHRAGYVS